MVHHASLLVKQIFLEVKRKKHGFSMVNDGEMGGFGFFLRQALMESISSKQLSEVTRSSDALGKWRDVDAAGAVG